jgi:hypothetical protein
MMITFGELLDLHDPHRDSNEYIHVMGEDNDPVMTGPVRSPYWEPFEDWLVTAIEAAAPRHMNVWLKEEGGQNDT